VGDGAEGLGPIASESGGRELGCGGKEADTRGPPDRHGSGKAAHEPATESRVHGVSVYAGAGGEEMGNWAAQNRLAGPREGSRPNSAGRSFLFSFLFLI
jgi:hypothetical protein